MVLEWNQVYSLDIEEIDEQHKKLFHIIGQLENMKIESGNSKEDVMDVLKELKDYGEYHFNTEEKYLKDHGYPGAENHMSIHEQYRKKIDNFLAQISFQSIDDYLEKIKIFLRNWWINHIQNTDQLYSKWLRLKDLK